MLWQATKAAVSVRSLLFPRETGMNPTFIELFISLFEKSPSGPIKRVVLSFGFKILFNDN